jgi:hypothetical protein
VLAPEIDFTPCGDKNTAILTGNIYGASPAFQNADFLSRNRLPETPPLADLSDDTTCHRPIAANRHADGNPPEPSYPPAAWALILISTPAGNDNLFKASIVLPVGCIMSISLLCVRISNCSRDFLSMCGLRNTV